MRSTLTTQKQIEAEEGDAEVRENALPFPPNARDAASVLEGEELAWVRGSRNVSLIMLRRNVPRGSVLLVRLSPGA